MLGADTGAVAAGSFSAAELNDLFLSLAGQRHAALAVSGGADSTALMHLAAAWAGQNDDAPAFSVLTIDHGLRAGSADEARQVGEWATALGLAHQVLNWEGEKPETGVQARARDARYRLLCGWCRDHDASHLVLAHHQQDQAETVLMRTAHGSGMDGLCGMRVSSWREGVRLARPLLDVFPDRLKAYLRNVRQGWIDDPSNQDRVFERVRVRSQLEAGSNRAAVVEALALSAHDMQVMRVALERSADELIGEAVTAAEGGFCHIDEALFRAAPFAAQQRALKRIVRAVGGAAHPPGRAPLARLAEALSGGEAQGGTLAGCRLLTARGRIWAVREERGTDEAVPLVPGRSMIWDNRFAVRAPEATQGPLTVAAVGEAHWPELRRLGEGALDDIPAAAGRSLPGFFSGGELLAAPHCGFGPRGFEADFIQMWRFAPENA